MVETSSRNKLVMKNTLMLYVRMFVIMGVTLFTSRVVLEALGEVDYGIYNVVAGVVVMMDFINAALYGATIRFMTYVMETGDSEVRNRTFSSIKFVHLVIGILTLVLGETVGLWFVMNKLTIPDSAMTATFWTYQCALLVLFISEISLPYSALIMAYERMSVFAYISVIEALLKLGIAYLVLYSTVDRLILYSVLFLAIQLLLRFVYAGYCNRHFVESKVKIRYDREDVRQIGKFTSWTILGSLTGMINTQGSNILLNIYFGPVVNTARGIAAQVHVACMKFCTNFQVAVKPQIIKSYSVGEIARMHNLVLISVKLCLFLTLIIVTPIYYYCEPILNIWLVQFPEETVFFVKIILIQQIFYSIGYPLTSAIEATGRLKTYQLAVCSVAILMVPVAWILLRFAHISADMVMVIWLTFTILSELVRILVVCPRIGMKLTAYLHRVVVYSIIPLAVITGGYCIIPHYETMTFINLLWQCIVVVSATCVVLYLFGINGRERSMVNSAVVKLCQRIGLMRT